MPFDPDFPLNIASGSVANSSGSSIVSEVYFRIGGQMPRTGASGSVLYYVNQALGIISGSATFVWDTNVVTVIIANATPTYDLSQLTGPLDLGGHIEVSNNNGIPITRADDERILFGRRLQYVTMNPVVFNQWYIVGTAPGIMHFKPNLGYDTPIQISYKMQPPVLTDSVLSLLRWNNPWMDALLCDFAEMEISRILGFAGWETLSQRCQAKLQDARSMFTMQRKDTGPTDEVQAGASGS